jgi:hypothetical protein
MRSRSAEHEGKGDEVVSGGHDDSHTAHFLKNFVFAKIRGRHFHQKKSLIKADR